MSKWKIILKFLQGQSAAESNVRAISQWTGSSDHRALPGRKQGADV